MKTRLALMTIGLALLASESRATACDDLAVRPPSGLRITASQSALPGTPTVCRVQGRVSSVPGSQIGFELWLPTSNWNGKFQMVGNGGYSSALDTRAMTVLINRGYAVAATDTGHTGDDPDFVVGHPEALADWGHRSVHETAVAAKALVASFYGRAPRYSYFSGCSTGGQQALMEAQRYPTDFDGIIAGAPGNNRTRLNLGFLWLYRVSHRADGSLILPPAKLPLLNAAVLDACAGKDGGLPDDRFLSAPGRCRFRPESLQCKRNVSDQSQCLTPEEVRSVQSIYRGAHNPRTRARLYYGWAKGTEMGWPGYWANPAKPGEPARLSFWQHWIFDDPEWTAALFDFDQDIARLDPAGRSIDAVNPDLSAFAKAGGKLIQFHGMADPVVPPDESITYYEQVSAKAGDPWDFFRLFMVPGLGHCQGGPGLTYVATQEALERWVEDNEAPTTLLATRFKSMNPADGASFTRPACPYPAQATYDGKGDRMMASSFTCKAPKSRRSNGLLR